MGDYEEQQWSDESIFLLPSPKELEHRLNRVKLRKHRQIDVGESRRILPFLPLLVKAEINPLLAGLEIILTILSVFCWFQALFWGGGVVVGGLALFLALGILHFWYGTSETDTSLR